MTTFSEMPKIDRISIKYPSESFEVLQNENKKIEIQWGQNQSAKAIYVEQISVSMANEIVNESSKWHDSPEIGFAKLNTLYLEDSYCLVSTENHRLGAGLLLYYSKALQEFHPFELKWNTIIQNEVDSSLTILKQMFKQCFLAIAEHDWLSDFIGYNPFQNDFVFYERDASHAGAHCVHIRICKPDRVLGLEDLVIDSIVIDSDSPINDEIPK